MKSPEDRADSHPRPTSGASARPDGAIAHPYLVKSLARGLSLLGLFDIDHPRRTLGDVVRETGWHKATCYRLLRTLEQEGFLAYDSRSGEYGLGVALLRLATLAQSGAELVRVADPFLSRLVEITGEHVDMTVWSDSGPLLAAQVRSQHRSFQPINTVGTIFTEAPTSHVRLWLAFGTDEQTRRLEDVLTTDPRDPSVSPASVLGGALDTVRDKGVAFDVGEARGVFSVAGPVFDATGRMVAGIAVVSAYERTRETERDLYAAAVRSVAGQLSRELGHAGG